MSKFGYEPKHYNGKFFHDLCWMPVELVRCMMCIISIPISAVFRLLGVRR